MPPTKLHHLHPKSLRSIPSRTHATPVLVTAPLATASSQALTTSSRPAKRSIAEHRSFTSLSRPPPLYPGHVPITFPERIAIALGSTLYSFYSPRRADLIALCSETTTPLWLLQSLRDNMLQSESGRRILRERPRISSETVSMEYLRTLPQETLGKVYVDWLDREHVTPDTRDPVRHVPEEELAYVLQRYRESHDLYHVLLAEKGMPSFLEGEVIVKAFEFAALGLPMTGLAAISAIKTPKAQRRRLLFGGKGGAGDLSWIKDEEPGINAQDSTQTTTIEGHHPSAPPTEGEGWVWWAVRQGLNTHSSSASHKGGLLSVYWEKEWETPMAELRERLSIHLPPGVGDLRAIRKRARDAKKKREAEAAAAGKKIV